MSVSTVPTGYPPGWKSDYDGETERWFYIHIPTGVRQYHFPKAGDEIELAAALTRSKSDREAKLQEANKAAVSKNSTNAILSSTSASQATVGASKQQQSFPQQTQIVAPISNAQQRNTSSASNPKPITAQSNTGSPIQQQPIRQATTSVPPPGIQQQNMQSTAYQAFVPIQEHAQPPIQQQSTQNIGYQAFVPSQQQQQYDQAPNQTFVHPSSPQHQALSTSGYQLPVMTQQLIGHNTAPHSINQSPAASISGRPQSIASSKGSVHSPAGEYRSYYSQTTAGSPISYAALSPAIPSKDSDPQHVAVALHPKQAIQQNNSTPARYNSADDVISVRIQILSLPDHDRETMIRNLRNLARIYPDVTFLRFVDPSIDLPLPNPSDFPYTDPASTQTYVPPAPSTYGASRRASEPAMDHHHETGMDRSSSISRDERVPTVHASQYVGPVYSCIAPSRESLLPHRPRRTPTSPSEFINGVGAPSSGSALDLHSNYAAAASTDSLHDNLSNIQVPLVMSQALSPDLNQQGAPSGHISHSLPRGMELVHVSDGPMITTKDIHGPSLSRGMPIADTPLNPGQKVEQSPAHVQSSHAMTVNNMSHLVSQATQQINSRASWEKTIQEGRELREGNTSSTESLEGVALPPASASALRQGSIARKPLAKHISSQSVHQQQSSSQPAIERSGPHNRQQDPLKNLEPKSLATILPHSNPTGGPTPTRSPSSRSVASKLTISSQNGSASWPASIHGFSSRTLPNQLYERQQSSPPIRLQAPSLQPQQPLNQQYPFSHQVLKTPAHTSETSNLPPQQIHAVTTVNQAPIAIATQQPSQDQAESGRVEFVRLNQIIKEQTEQLLLLYRQNLQNLQTLQSQQITIPAQQNGQQPQSPVRKELVQQNNNQIGVPFEQARSAPNPQGVPATPISPPDSLVSVQHTLSMPMTAFETVMSQSSGKGEVVEKTTEVTEHACDISTEQLKKNSVQTTGRPTVKPKPSLEITEQSSNASRSPSKPQNGVKNTPGGQDTSVVVRSVPRQAQNRPQQQQPQVRKLAPQQRQQQSNAVPGPQPGPLQQSQSRLSTQQNNVQSPSKHLLAQQPQAQPRPGPQGRLNKVPQRKPILCQNQARETSYSQGQSPQVSSLHTAHKPGRTLTHISAGASRVRSPQLLSTHGGSPRRRRHVAARPEARAELPVLFGILRLRYDAWDLPAGVFRHSDSAGGLRCWARRARRGCVRQFLSRDFGR